MKLGGVSIIIVIALVVGSFTVPPAEAQTGAYWQKMMETEGDIIVVGACYGFGDYTDQIYLLRNDHDDAYNYYGVLIYQHQWNQDWSCSGSHYTQDNFFSEAVVYTESNDNVIVHAEAGQVKMDLPYPSISESWTPTSISGYAISSSSTQAQFLMDSSPSTSAADDNNFYFGVTVRVPQTSSLNIRVKHYVDFYGTYAWVVASGTANEYYSYNPNPAEPIALWSHYKTSSSIGLQWTQATSGPHHRYDLYMSTNPSFTPSTSTWIHTTSDYTSTSFTKSGLASSQTYYFIIRQYNIYEQYSQAFASVTTSASTTTTPPPTTPPPSGGGGGSYSCPYLYIWNGTDYVIDNSLLTASEIKEHNMNHIYDYHLIKQGSVVENGSYKFRIMESEAYERSYIDNLELLTVDYSGDFNIGVTFTGEILTYEEPESPLSAMDSNGVDILPSVVVIDEAFYDGYLNDEIIVNFTNLPDHPAKLVMRSDVKCDYAYSPISIDALYGPITISVLDNEGNWQEAGSIVPRELWAIDMLDISSYLPQSSSVLSVKLSWLSHHKLDYIGLDRSEQGEIDVSTHDLLSANHSVIGDVMDNITVSDNDYVQLLTGEYVDFEFPALIQTTPKRDLILYSKGFYEFDTDYTLVEGIDIFQNINISVSITGTVGNTVNISSLSQNNSGMTKQLNATQVSTILGEDLESTFNTKGILDSNSMLYFAYDSNTQGDNIVNVSIETMRRSPNNKLSYLHTSFNLSFSSSDPANHSQMININDILTDFYDQGALLYYAPSFSYIGIINVVKYDWQFDNEPNITFDDANPRELLEIAPGQHNVTLRLLYESNLMVALDKTFVLNNKKPQVDFSTYQEVDINLEVAGRKGNTITLEIYEDDLLIDSMPVTRTPGKPNVGDLTLKKYLDKDYSFMLVYDATHKGANPVWLTFETGSNSETFFYNFNPEFDMYDEVVVDSTICDYALEGNSEYFFDASNSYDIDGSITSYEWSFDDGATATGEMVSHEYSEPGTYYVRLRITDDDGITARTSTTIVVS